MGCLHLPCCLPLSILGVGLGSLEGMIGACLEKLRTDQKDWVIAFGIIS